MEDTIKVYGDTMVNSQTEENRFIASYRIVKNLVSILKIKNSYQYQLDSLLPMQILNSPDNKFRIFTWFVINDNQQYRYFGAIQMNSDTLSLFPLVDYSEFIEKPETQTVDNNNWYGALYYQIVPVKQKKKTYYMLLGSNGFTLVSNKKVMDVLWFSEDNKPRFGAPLIEKDNKTLNRFILEFSNDTWAALRYVPEETKIIYDHVLPNDEDLVGFFSQYLPDGTYEGFQWKKGKWQHIDMIEYQKREDGEAPNVQKKEKIDYKNLYKKKVQ
ncbi:MAG: hypothetical protein K1X26_09015 [Chitinophagales bacterium]|nr:hypothetical protein [Chitinophagales bacterium]HMV03158.1 hypothetical protein [Chitinophagales bacterium]HMY43566.1 hypothetical protein [Chitinophagales bacterium]HNB38866.1 hypothetical protein [Chitinophagales bacterium]HNJ11320.1 hypothetical protein [Chitinophagales bacterium]